MEAKDLAPSRVARARFALADLLHAARDARVALIVFAGEAHVVTPLTTDVANVGALLQPLSPSLMPEAGHALGPALDAALQLLQSGGSRGGAVVVLTDGCDDWPAAFAAAARLRQAGVALHVVGVGTEAGAPEPDGAGGFLRDAQGGAVLTRLPAERLQRVAREGGGDYVTLEGVPGLIASLQRPPSPMSAGLGSPAGLKVEAWRNAGYWLLLPLLGLVALLARRGWL
jgi:Ca-activated chloride channel family protein